MFNKVTIKGAKQVAQMFGPAQHGVAKAVMDCVAEGTTADEAENLFISVGVFIHWLAEDDKKIKSITTKRQRNQLKELYPENLGRRRGFTERFSRASIRCKVRFIQHEAIREC